jgi:hypothetical protein
MNHMRSPFVGAVVAAVVAAVALAACTPGSGAGTPAPSSPPDRSPSPSPAAPGIVHPTGASDVVIRIERMGGFVAPGWVLTALPDVSVYGDGLVVTQGVQVAIYPAPALPAIVQSRVSEAGLQRILEDARSAGLLGPDRRFENPGITDVPWTVFTVAADGATHTTSAYALREGEDSPSVPADERVARGELTAFSAKLQDLSWLGADVVATSAPYEYANLRVFVMPAQPDQTAEIQPSFADWPLAGDLASFGAPLTGYGSAQRCGIVSGADLASLRGALQAANALTFWKSGGATYQLGLRPLLPDEQGCPPGR